MKPTKNNFFCIQSKKTKMRFETAKKAMNFIKFNQYEILNESKEPPIRTYYCDHCQAWHVTSQVYVLTGYEIERITELVEALNVNVSILVKLKTNSVIIEKLQRIIELMKNINFFFKTKTYHYPSLKKYNGIKIKLIKNDFILNFFTNDKSEFISNLAKERISILTNENKFNQPNTYHTWENVLESK